MSSGVVRGIMRAVFRYIAVLTRVGIDPYRGCGSSCPFDIPAVLHDLELCIVTSSLQLFWITFQIPAMSESGSGKFLRISMKFGPSLILEAQKISELQLGQMLEQVEYPLGLRNVPVEHLHGKSLRSTGIQ